MLLITGASGHTARYFLKRLEAEGYAGKIRCLIREHSNTSHLEKLKLDIEFCVADINDRIKLAPALDGVETVLHTAGIYLSPKLLEAGKQAGVAWFICIHTTGRYSKIRSANENYIAIEDKLMKDYSNLTILRPTMIYGSKADKNMWKLVHYLDKHKYFPVFGAGEALMQPVYVGDLADACYLTLQNRPVTMGKQYNISGKEAITYKNLLKQTCHALGKQVKFIHVPIWISISGAAVLNLLFKKYKIISVEKVRRISENKSFPWQKAADDFGYSPRGFAEGIQKEVQEYHLRTYAERELLC